PHLFITFMLLSMSISTLFPYTTLFRSVQLNTEQLEIHTTWNPEKFQLSPSGTIIDAMFGTGLKRPLEGQWRDIAVWLNEQNNLTDRKSTRLNSSHVKISYAVFCLKKKN